MKILHPKPELVDRRRRKKRRGRGRGTFNLSGGNNFLNSAVIRHSCTQKHPVVWD